MLPHTYATPAEAAARIVTRHPAASQAAARALDLVEAGHVAPDGRAVRATGGDDAYRLTYVPATGAWLCTCPAFVYRPTIIGGRHYCKHTLARAIAERSGMLGDERRVNAIWQAGGTHYAAVERPGRREETATLTRAEYDALEAQAGDDDYREGNYIGFARSIEWADVFSEDRVP